MEPIVEWTAAQAFALRKAKRLSIESFASELGISPRTVANWRPASEAVPNLEIQSVLDTALAQSDEQCVAIFEVACKKYARDQSIEEPRTEREIIMASAKESVQHVGKAELSNIGGTTIDQLRGELQRLSQEYVHREPLPMIVEMTDIRRRVYELLEGRQRPSDAGQLYFIAGGLSGLLANASCDLGYHSAANDQARAAYAYAEIAGHNGLRAWTRGMQALIAYWQNQPRRGIELVQGGYQYAVGTASVRLKNIEARIWSETGAADEVTRCLADAADVQQADNELHDEVSGVFGFTPAKSHYYAGATWLHLQRSENAAREASQAIDMYTHATPELRSYGAESLARIDLYRAQLLQGQPDSDALRPVLELPQSKRIAQIVDRCHQVRRDLTAFRRQGVAVATELDAEIEEFCATPAQQS